jgi:hypothetical protein
MPFKNRAALRQYQSEWHAENSVRRAKKIKQSRIILRDEVNVLKERRGCTDCKRRYPYYVLQFDHLDGSKKVAGIQELIRCSNRDGVVNEIAKCEVVCANCHAVRTFKRTKGLSL